MATIMPWSLPALLWRSKLEWVQAGTGSAMVMMTTTTMATEAAGMAVNTAALATAEAGAATMPAKALVRCLAVDALQCGALRMVDLLDAFPASPPPTKCFLGA